MKFTNNRKKAVNLNPKTEGKYSWDLGSVVFEPRPYKQKEEKK